MARVLPIASLPLLALSLLAAGPWMDAALARPMRGGGVGGGFGGGVGGPASGAGARPGAGWGGAGAGFTRAPGASAWNPAWAGRGYWSTRTWTTGWYRPYPTAWGVTGLATAAAITSAVDAAAAQQSTVIVVPQTSLQLDYGSIRALPPSGVQFAVAAAGMPYATVTSDCKQGLINGVPPSTADQAQLLNASCQIAYGSV